MSRAGFEAFPVSLFFLDGVDQVGFLHLAGSYFHLLSYFFDFLDFHFAFSSLFFSLLAGSHALAARIGRPG